MKEKELKQLKLTKNIIIPFPNFQQNTIISPTQMNDNFEEIEYAYNNLIDNHNGAITKMNEALAEITSTDNEAISNEQARIQAEEIRIQNEEQRISNENERRAEEKKRIAMYNVHLNDELRREQKHTEMVNTFDTKVSEVNTFVDTKKEEINSFVDTKTEEVEEFVDLKTNQVAQKMIEVDSAEAKRQQEHESRQAFLDTFEEDVKAIESHLYLKTDPKKEYNFSKIEGEFITKTLEEVEDGYHIVTTELTTGSTHTSYFGLGVKANELEYVKVTYEFLENSPRTFIGLGSSFYWGNMYRVDFSGICKGEVIFTPDKLPANVLKSNMLVFIGSPGTTTSRIVCKFKIEYKLKSEQDLISEYAKELTVDGMEKIIETVKPLAFDEVVSRINEVPIGLRVIPFKDYLVRDNTNNAVTISSIGEGWVNVKKEGSEIQGTKYQGIYAKFNYPNFDDLDGDCLVEVVSKDGKALPNETRILYGVTDWGHVSSGASYIPLNTKFNLKEKLLSNPNHNYPQRTSFYFSIVKYNPNGVYDSCDWDIRITFIPKKGMPVVATDLTSDLKTSLVEELKRGSESYITCWGDSLTAGGGWTSTLESLSGLKVYNGGTGGENSRTIMARQGGDVMIVNNITIPANTNPITIATRSGDGGISTYFGHKVTPLLQGGAHVNPCYIGDVKGTLRWTGSAHNDMNGTWTFTRAEAGKEVVINRPTAIRTDFDINRNSPKIMILFIGQNGGYDNFEHLIQQHRLMIEHSNCEYFIVLGLSSGTANQRAEYENAMRKEFGRRFISLREYLSQYGLDDAGITPTEQDLSMMAQGQTPQSLLTDSVHYNSACKTVIGNMIYRKIKELNMI